MTDEQLIELLQTMEKQLESLRQEIAIIREAVLLDLSPIMAMHAGKPASTEKE